MVYFRYLVTHDNTGKDGVRANFTLACPGDESDNGVGGVNECDFGFGAGRGRVTIACCMGPCRLTSAAGRWLRDRGRPASLTTHVGGGVVSPTRADSRRVKVCTRLLLDAKAGTLCETDKARWEGSTCDTLASSGSNSSPAATRSFSACCALREDGDGGGRIYGDRRREGDAGRGVVRSYTGDAGRGVART